MTDELENLRPEVRSALGAIVRADVCRDPVPTDAFDTIRAELLRLAAENASMRAAWHDALLPGTGILKVERIDPATVMLPVEPRQEPTK